MKTNIIAIIIILVLCILSNAFALTPTEKQERIARISSHKISKQVVGSIEKFTETFDKYDIHIDQQDDKGNTILLQATKAANTKLVKHLLDELNADPDIENDAGELPLLIAISNNWYNIVFLLLEANANTADIKITDNTDADIIKLLSDYGVW